MIKGRKRRRRRRGGEGKEKGTETAVALLAAIASEALGHIALNLTKISRKETKTSLKIREQVKIERREGGRERGPRSCGARRRPTAVA